MSTTHSGREFYAGLLEALTQVMGLAKGYLVGHGPRVALLAGRLGESLGVSRREISELLFASILSDMGMVGLAEDAWENPVPELPPEVRRRVRQHPVRSEERVSRIPHFEALAPLIRHHHEWWDGSGYPDGLAGNEIPMGAQILRLADTVVALGQARPHRPAASIPEVLEVVERGIGVEFGPMVAREYLSLARAGEIPDFEHAAFRRAVARATEHLLPEQVSPLSGDQLLGIVANLIDAKDPYTAGHSRRVAAFAVAVAVELGLGDEVETALWAGGYLHDLGKLRVPLRILAKQCRLSEAEYARVRFHPVDGARILETIPSLRHLTAGALHHHERWNGEGYPMGLRGSEIPLVGRVLAVCDSYDAMTSRRAYRDGRAHRDALAEVTRCVGTHFSPKVTEAFASLPEDLFEAVRTEPPPHRGAVKAWLRSRGRSAAVPSFQSAAMAV